MRKVRLCCRSDDRSGKPEKPSPPGNSKEDYGQSWSSQEWKSSRRIYVVRGEINEKTAYIQARSSMARNLENNGKECQAEGEAKVV